MRHWLHFIFPLLAASAFANAPERIRFSPGAHQLTASAAHSSGQFVTNRTMPGSLQWNATYNNAGQMTKEWLMGTSSVGTRTNSYSYYGAGSPLAGLLQTRINPNGRNHAHMYDDWLRLTNVYRPTETSQGALITEWSYDTRGFATNITELNDGSAGFGPTVVRRSYDAYGQLTAETVSVNGSIYSAASQTGASQSWDAAGRRVGLGMGNGYNFTWRADGMMASASSAGATATYSYDTAGVLTNRLVGNRATTITSRDGTGRPLSITTKVNTVTKLTETLAYTGDGLLSTHTLAREDFTDSRSYSYANLSRRLVEERLNLDASKRWTNLFTYDNGTPGGAGILTRVGTTPSSPQWSGGVSSLARVNTETNTNVRYPAYGRVNGPSTVTATLDGVPQQVSLLTVDALDSQWPYQWQTIMELSPGAHQLSATALHPSGQFTTNRSVWFTNNLAYEAAPVILRDASGNVTSKIWRKPDGSEIHGIQMWVDPKDRVYRLEVTTANGTGYRVLTDYDAFGRRLRTRWSTLTADLDPLGYVETLSHYDPMAEFLELGVTVKHGVGAVGQSEWKLCGPDLNGVYGAMNGTGGFEASSSGGSSSMSPTIADARGNILGSLNSQLSTINWTAARPTGYGAVPGYRPLPLGHGGNLVQSSAWRGRYMDITGRVNLGARFYDHETGSFESYDPTWNDRDPNYLTYAGGNPIDYFDADGRIATQIGKGIGGGYTQGDFYNAGDNFDRETGQFIGQIAGGLTPGWGQISDYRDTAAALNTMRTEGLGWGTGIGLVLSAVAWVPGVGDAVKGIGKSILRSFDDVPVSAVTPSHGDAYTFDFMNPGPLDDRVAGTFAGGRYSEGIVQPNQTFYKGGDAANPGGSFFNFDPPNSIAQTRIDNAVRPQWIDPQTGVLRGESPINSAIAARFPEGTPYYYGPVSSQGGVFVGGQDKIQIFIPDARNAGTFTPIAPLK